MSIASEHLVYGKHLLRDLVDIDQLRGIFQHFSQTTGFAATLVSHPEQKLLVRAGWRDLCTKFHQTVPAAKAHCIHLNPELSAATGTREAQRVYSCQHGLADSVAPILIEQTHVAELYVGQILLEQPDIARFKKQSEVYGFDADAYLAALQEVPVVSEEKLMEALSFLAELTVQFAEHGLIAHRSREREQETCDCKERLELVLGGADLGTWDWNLATGEVLYNERWAEMLGYTLNELKPSLDTWSELIHPADAASTMAALNAHLAGKTDFYESDHRLRHKLGDWIWVHDRGKVITRGADGQALRACGTHQDITERKLAEKAFKQQRDLFLAGPAVAFKWINAESWPVEYVSPNVSQFGYSVDDWISGRVHFAGIVHEDDLERVAQEVQAYSEEGRLFFEQWYRIYTADREVRWIYDYTNVIRNEQGQITHYHGFILDITKRKLAEQALKRSEEFSRTIVENAPLGISVRDATGKLLACNQQWQQIWDHSDEDVARAMNRQPQELKFDESDDYLDAWRDKVKRIYQEGGTLAIPELKTTPKRPGMAQWVSNHFYAITNDRGEVDRVVVLTEDITERKLAEEKLRNSQNMLETILDNMPGGTVLIGEDYIIKQVNKRTCAITGYSEEELVGRLCDIICPKGSASRACPIWEENAAGFVGMDTAVKCKDGHRNPILKNAQRIRINGKNYILENFQDITERKRAEDSLRKSEERLRTAGKAAYDLIYEWDVLSDSLKWFGDIDGMLGYEPGEISRNISSWLALIHPEDRSQLAAAVELHRSSIQPIRYDYRIRKMDGSYRHWRSHGLPMLDEQERPYRWIGVCTDITEQKQAERERSIRAEIFKAFLTKKDQDLYEAVLNIVLKACESEFGVFGFIDEEGSLVCPSMTKHIWDQCQMSGKTITFPQKAWGNSIWGNALRTGEPGYSNEPSQVPAGHIPIRNSLAVPLVCRGKPIGLLLVANKPRGYNESDREFLLTIGNNIAPVLDARLDRKRAEEEKTRLEERLRQIQKMEAIGTLAGGIAHDFNNILFSILGNADIAADSIPENHAAHEYLHEIVVAGQRATGLVKQILTFARKTDKRRTAVQVSSIVKEVAKMLRAMLPTTIDINLRLKTEHTTIVADPTEIHQVVMNLCTNAGQAMIEGGGELEICISQLFVDELFRERHPDLRSGHHLVLSVSDTGPGIPPEDLERLFEPFFTTKKEGQGTGMGLAVVHGIVRDLGGAIYVFSDLGQGTTFNAYLPLVEIEPIPLARQTEGIPRGTEKVMVVDDEVALTSAIKRVLENLGYSVEAFSDSTQALKAFLAAPSEYDVILTDQTMPKLTGAQLAKKILAVQPSLPVLLLTGFSQTMPREKAKSLGISAYLNKPVSTKDLALAIRRALDEKKPQPK